jgi:release factor glutamine methyltransferase
LNSGGWLLLEHGFDQTVALRDVLAQRSLNKASRLAGERCSGGQWLA